MKFSKGLFLFATFIFFLLALSSCSGDKKKSETNDSDVDIDSIIEDDQMLDNEMKPDNYEIEPEEEIIPDIDRTETEIDIINDQESDFFPDIDNVMEILSFSGTAFDNEFVKKSVVKVFFGNNMLGITETDDSGNYSLEINSNEKGIFCLQIENGGNPMNSCLNITDSNNMTVNINPVTEVVYQVYQATNNFVQSEKDVRKYLKLVDGLHLSTIDYSKYAGVLQRRWALKCCPYRIRILRGVTLAG